jgi:hypothetical protein
MSFDLRAATHSKKDFEGSISLQRFENGLEIEFDEKHPY